MAINPFYNEKANHFEQDDELELIQASIDKSKREIHVASFVKISKNTPIDESDNTIRVTPFPLSGDREEKVISAYVICDDSDLTKDSEDRKDCLGLIVYTDLPSLAMVKAYMNGTDYAFKSTSETHSMNGAVLIACKEVG